ncbi:MAG TPA: hypothetical protein VK797_27900 [Tepidisphaeraceae bacterium]|jgi:hypothetical protein|nr:hypothetical protein [Tepidisphaeraceae bacterium]
MYPNTIRPLVAMSMLVFCTCGVSCASNNSEPAAGDGTDRQVSIVRTSDGATVTELYTATATVSDIDRSTRSVTLAAPDGKKTTFKAGDDVRNFDQIAVGDHVTAQVWEVLAVHLVRKGNPSASDADAAVVAARAPKGAKPGGFVVASTEEFATVIAVDPESRWGTLKFPDGKWRSLQAGENVDLTNVKPGDKVSIRHTEGAAISVEGKQ